MAERSVAAQCEARLGQSLRGKWTLERLLGIGGMAAVYVGVHKIGRKDAIKILHPEVARSKELNLRFEQEARAVNRFAHPGAVEIRDIDVGEDGCPFLVMELLEGENLGERAARLGGIPNDELLRLADELLDVLAAAHAQGIVHRDIKLDNLFVTTEGKLKVLDFGIARVKAGPAITMIGARLGTTAYMAPEQVQGGEVDARADLFAVGATLFRLLTKRRIHEATSDVELVTKMASMPAPRLASVAADVDPGLAAVVDRALQFAALDRYPNALTMQGDVRALREGEPPPFATARAAMTSTGPTATPAPIAATAASAFAREPTGAAYAPEATAAAHLSMTPAPTSLPYSHTPGPSAAGAPSSLGPPSPVSMRGPMQGAYEAAPQSIPYGAPVSMRGPASMGASNASFPSPAGAAAGSTGVAYAAPMNVPVAAMPGRVATQRSSAGLVLGIVALVGLLAVGTGGYLLFAGSSSTSASEESDDAESGPTHAKRKKAAAPEAPTATATATATAAATASPAAPSATAEPAAQPSATGAVVETWPSSPNGGGTMPTKPATAATVATKSEAPQSGGLVVPIPTSTARPGGAASAKGKPAGAGHTEKPKR